MNNWKGWNLGWQNSGAVNKNNHPFLIYGPYTNPSNVLYYEIQKIRDVSGYPWENLISGGSSMSYEDSAESLILGRYTHTVAYRVVAYMESLPPAYSNSDSLALIVNGRNLKQNNSPNNDKKLIEYSLSQNYPNPFNPQTCIRYSIKDINIVKLQIFDVLGREIETLVNEEKLAGNYELNFNCKKLTSGVYFYKLKAGTFTEIKKMQYLK